MEELILANKGQEGEHQSS